MSTRKAHMTIEFKEMSRADKLLLIRIYNAQPIEADNLDGDSLQSVTDSYNLEAAYKIPDNDRVKKTLVAMRKGRRTLPDEYRLGYKTARKGRVGT